MKRFLLLTLGSILSLCVGRAQTVPWAGGPVVQNARVVVIYWGQPDPSLRAALDRFYSQITGSSYLSRLWEYGTGPVSTSIPSHFRVWFGYPTDQVVGAGIYAGSYVIQATASGNVETTDIGPQLDHEIHVGHIPAPDRNTIYMVHFSKAQKVYLGTNILGIPVGAPAGQGFSGYHAAYFSTYTNRAMVFAVLPNQASLQGLSSAMQAFPAETLTASHELVEAITDPGSDLLTGGFLSVALATDEQAWRIWHGFSGTDPIEIADECENNGGLTLRTSPDPHDAYYVSKTWSNRMSACVGSGPVGSLDGFQVDAGGTPHIYGWTVDPSQPGRASQVHVYFDGPYPWGKGYAVVADRPRGDVNSGTGYLGNHGFDLTVPAEMRDGRTHTVYAYGIGFTPGNNEFLGGSPLTFNSASQSQTPAAPIMIASAKDAGKCLDITGGVSWPGTPVQLYSCLGSDNQRFSYHADTQELRAYNNSSLCLDIAGIGASADGAPIVLGSCSGSPMQKWSFNLNNGEIRGAYGHCMQPGGSTIGNGTPAQLWTCNHDQAQAWFRK